MLYQNSTKYAKTKEKVANNTEIEVKNTLTILHLKPQVQSKITEEHLNTLKSNVHRF
jgi:hypothetical protein